jgi:hypothetical protein
MISYFINNTQTTTHFLAYEGFRMSHFYMKRLSTIKRRLTLKCTTNATERYIGLSALMQVQKIFWGYITDSRNEGRGEQVADREKVTRGRDGEGEYRGQMARYGSQEYEEGRWGSSGWKGTKGRFVDRMEGEGNRSG